MGVGGGGAKEMGGVSKNLFRSFFGPQFGLKIIKEGGGGGRGAPRDPPLSSDPNFHWPIYWHWSITSLSEANRKGADGRFAFHLHMHANEAWTAEQDSIKE